MNERFVRLGEVDRAEVQLVIDGRRATGLAGDTLLVSILNNQNHLRESEFDGGKRAGFCLMGACQDCWVWTASGERIRACTTVIEEGMHINTRSPEPSWAILA